MKGHERAGRIQNVEVREVIYVNEGVKFVIPRAGGESRKRVLLEKPLDPPVTPGDDGCRRKE